RRSSGRGRPLELPEAMPRSCRVRKPAAHNSRLPSFMRCQSDGFLIRPKLSKVLCGKAEGDEILGHWGSALRPVSVAGKRQVALLIVVGVAFVASVIALSAWQLWRSRADALAEGLRDSRNMTAVL